MGLFFIPPFALILCVFLILLLEKCVSVRFWSLLAGCEVRFSVLIGERGMFIL